MQRINVQPKIPKQALQEKDEIVKKLKDHPLIDKFMRTHNVDFDFIVAHASRFERYVDDLSLCENCKGLFACAQLKTGHILSLTMDDGVLVNEILKCGYLLEDENKKAHLKNFVINDMPSNLVNLRLKDFKLDHETYEYLKLFDYVFSWSKKPTFKTLFLHGTPGSGKTYLLSALANELALKNNTVAFVSVPAFISKAKLYFDNLDEMQKMIEKVKEADVVILDDIGAENITAWSRDELLFPILNYRLESKKSIWFTSNETIETLKQHYAIDQKGKTSLTKAMRMIERIVGCAQPYQLVEDNRRNISSNI